MNSTDIKDNILNPNKFNVSSGNSSYELWNKGNTITTANNNAVNKTIYSMSPSNYVEPRSAAYTGLTSSNISSTYNYGIYYFANPNTTGNTIYFYTNGYRQGANSFIENWHYYGHYWTSGPANSSQAISFCLVPTGTIAVSTTDYRNHGFDMRCVLE